MAQAYTRGTAWRLASTEGRSVLIDQAMEMLGVSKRTVYYWIRQGRLQTIRTRCGSQRVLVSSMAGLSASFAPAPPSLSAASREESSEFLNSLSA